MTDSSKTHSPRLLEERFQSLREVLASKSFLARDGIINEVPFFIFAYDPSQENQVQELTRHLLSQLEKSGIALLEINLFDLAVEIIEKRGKWDRILLAEPGMSKDKFKTQLQNLTDAQDKLTPAIGAKIAENPGIQILFLTGVGLVYPFIRAHSVLNNLQKVAKDYPTLLFFPGEYTFTEGRGQSLDLFGELNEDKYYRAFNIEDYKLQP